MICACGVGSEVNHRRRQYTLGAQSLNRAPRARSGRRSFSIRPKTRAAVIFSDGPIRFLRHNRQRKISGKRVTRQTALGAFHESKSDLSGVSFGQEPSLPAEELQFLHHSPGATDRSSSLLRCPLLLRPPLPLGRGDLLTRFGTHRPCSFPFAAVGTCAVAGAGE